MQIYIIRHGETKANEQGRLQGWLDLPLNDMGVLLAEETGKAMKGLKFDAVFSSPLIRAKQTAEILLKEIGAPAEIQTDDRLKEINMGDCDGKQRVSETGETFPAVDALFNAPLDMQPFPNGESVRAVMARTQAFLKEIAAGDYQRVLVSTHGIAVRCMLNFLYDRPEDFWRGRVPLNCCINVVEVSDGRLQLTEQDKILYDSRYCVDRYARR